MKNLLMDADNLYSQITPEQQDKLSASIKAIGSAVKFITSDPQLGTAVGALFRRHLGRMLASVGQQINRKGGVDRLVDSVKSLSIQFAPRLRKAVDDARQ